MIAHGMAILLATAVTAPGADEHLLAGATAFREGRFEAALVEFRVAGRLGAADAGAYAGAALVKLRRPEEAVEAFAASPPGDDELLGWYHAVACFDARLYGCAGRVLEATPRGGPRASAEAVRLREEIARVLAAVPAVASVEWYLARCEARRGERRTALAAAYCREAADLGARRADRHGVSRAQAALGRLAPAAAPGRPR
jgi:hypothetical protein